MSSRFDPHDPFLVDSNGCFQCDYEPKVKGRFGLAWVSESPECPYPEPVGWQVEFHDTPSKVEQKCQEMVRWINCPPLPRCDPCPPVELCCHNQSPKKKCSCKKQQQQQSQHEPQCTCCNKPHRHHKKKCCFCGGQSRQGGQSRNNCYANLPGSCNNCRSRSPKRY